MLCDFRRFYFDLFDPNKLFEIMLFTAQPGMAVIPSPPTPSNHPRPSYFYFYPIIHASHVKDTVCSITCFLSPVYFPSPPKQQNCKYCTGTPSPVALVTSPRQLLISLHFASFRFIAMQPLLVLRLHLPHTILLYTGGDRQCKI